MQREPAPPQLFSQELFSEIQRERKESRGLWVSQMLLGEDLADPPERAPLG